MQINKQFLVFSFLKSLLKLISVWNKWNNRFCFFLLFLSYLNCEAIWRKVSQPKIHSLCLSTVVSSFMPCSFPFTVFCLLIVFILLLSNSFSHYLSPLLASTIFLPILICFYLKFCPFLLSQTYMYLHVLSSPFHLTWQ